MQKHMFISFIDDLLDTCTNNVTCYCKITLVQRILFVSTFLC